MKRSFRILALTAGLLLIGTAPASAAVTQVVDDDGLASPTATQPRQRPTPSKVE